MVDSPGPRRELERSRVLEPMAGSAVMSGPVPASPGHCANCGTRVDGQYCSACGQSRRELDRSALHFVKEFIEEILRLEGRAYATLRLLASQPGVVSAEYLAGRRVRYTPPLRLYLVSSATFVVGFRLTRPVDQAYFGYGSVEGAYLDTLANVLILLLPMLAVLLKLVYVRSGRPLIHHLIFSLYTGAAALLWLLLLTLASAALKALWGHHTGAPAWLPDSYFFWLYLPGLAAFLGYLTVALRRTYGSGWVGSVSRTLVLVLGTSLSFFLLFWVYALVQRGS